LKDLNESDQNNPRRLIRFLERSFEKNQKGPELKHLYLVLDIEKEVLEKRIKERVELMFEKGLLEENKALFEKGKRVDTIGYKEFYDFFEGKITLDVVKENIFINTKKYAKRQITWFKRNENAIWVKDYKEALDLCKNFLSS
jgi:tRNA dimethylallyltransferase